GRSHQAPGPAARGPACLMDRLVEDEDIAPLDAPAALVADGVAAAHHDAGRARAFGTADEEMFGALADGLGDEQKAEKCRGDHTSRLCFTAAAMKLANNGWGSKGLDFSSGWNWTPMNQGWSGRSTISGSSPSGLMPLNTS